MSPKCYPLEEILAEKIRAVSGQRRFAISRDLYDIHRLVKAGVSIDKTVSLLPKKFSARGLDIESLDIQYLLNRQAEFEWDWKRRLSYLIPERETPLFQEFWQTAIDTFQQVELFIQTGG